MNPISISAISREAMSGLKGNTALQSGHQTPQTDFASTVDQIQRQIKETATPATSVKQPIPTAERSSPLHGRCRTTKSDHALANGAPGMSAGKFLPHDGQAAIPGCLTVTPADAQAGSAVVSNGEGDAKDTVAEVGSVQAKESSSTALTQSELPAGTEPQPTQEAEQNTSIDLGDSKASPTPNSVISLPEIMAAEPGGVAPDSKGKPQVSSDRVESGASQPSEKHSTDAVASSVPGPALGLAKNDEAVPLKVAVADVATNTVGKTTVVAAPQSGTVNQKTKEIQSQNSSEENADQPVSSAADASVLFSLNGTQHTTTGLEQRLDETRSTSLQQRVSLQFQSPADSSAMLQGAVGESDQPGGSQAGDASSSEWEPQLASPKDRRPQGNSGAVPMSAVERDIVRGSNSDSATPGTQNLAGTSPTESAAGAAGKDQGQTDRHGSTSELPRPTEPSETKFVLAPGDSIKRGEIHVSLQSDTLGSVELRARVRGENVAASIAVEKKDTQQLLNDALPSLHQALSDRRLRLDQISIKQSFSDVSAQTSQPQQGDSSNPRNPEPALGRMAAAGTSFFNPVFTSAASAGDEGIFDREGRLSVRV